MVRSDHCTNPSSVGSEAVRAPDDRTVRPTLRCLIDDLGSEVGPPELRAVLGTITRSLEADSRYLLPVPLASAEHIVLDKANMIALDPSADREPIEVISDREAIKVKTADRRGALWRDDEGNWWLLAAGRRKNDSPGDFYREMERHTGNSDAIGPTEQDLRYLRYETAYIAECNAERNAQTEVIRAVLRAAAAPGAPQKVEVFGAEVTVIVDRSDEETETLSVAFDFTRFDERDRFPVDVVGFVPGYDTIDDWDILPPLRPGDPECWYTFVSAAWIEWLAIAVELDGLLRDGTSVPTPQPSMADGHSHWAAATVVTVGYVEGVEITALCGVRFTPHRDPDSRSVCPACDAALRLLRSSSV